MTPEQLAARIVKPLGPWKEHRHGLQCQDYIIELFTGSPWPYRLYIPNAPVGKSYRNLAAAQAAAEAHHIATHLAALDLSPVLALVEAAQDVKDFRYDPNIGIKLNILEERLANLLHPTGGSI